MSEVSLAQRKFATIAAGAIPWLNPVPVVERTGYPRGFIRYNLLLS